MRPKKYMVRLTELEKKRLAAITKKRDRPARQIIRAKILLLLNEEPDRRGKPKPVPEQREIADRCHCEIALIYRVSRQYAEEGIERVLNRKQRKVPLSMRVRTGRAEARICELYNTKPPYGYDRWSLRLLAEVAQDKKIVHYISAPTVAAILKKWGFKPHLKKNRVKV
ncbi:hypothetical protein FACS1894106_0160 [Spirochaetia bacterium]|nr:hypothetical protein FACS1894106_0160 [Spirochaetia bacterium]